VSDFIGVWCEGYSYLSHEELPFELISVDNFLKDVYPVVFTLFGDTDEKSIIELVGRGGENGADAVDGLYFKAFDS